MAKRKPAKPKPRLTLEEASARLETVLAGGMREAIVADAFETGDFAEALRRVGAGMRSNRFQAGGETLSLERIVNRFDALNRDDGFHVLHDWDGVAERLLHDTIPVDVLEYVGRSRIEPGSERTVLAILLDYYFLYLLCLASLRVWDEGDANENLGGLSRLLDELQGERGSGQQFVEDAETLILVATSHFEADDTAYDRLLDKIRTLGAAHRTRLALAHAPILASHLRFGFEATYGRDVVEMRNDNVPDYPWLSFALVTLLEAYERLGEGNEADEEERDRILESLLNGLTPDPRAFVGKPPAALEAQAAELSGFRDLFRAHEGELMEEFERFRPSEEAYSPIAFYFNFTHNLLKAIVVDALLRGRPWSLPVNALFTGVPKDAPGPESREALARTLMEYARSSPDRIRGRLVPVIVYDPRKGRRAFTTTLERLRAP